MADSDLLIRVSAALLLLSVKLGAIDVGAEPAAWAPLETGRDHAVTDQVAADAADGRAAEPRYASHVGLEFEGWLLGAPAQRLDAGLVRTRNGAPVDGQVVVGYVESDYRNPAHVNFRQGSYLRAGSDPLAERAGRGEVAIGGEMLFSLGGSPLGGWVEGGRSAARGFTAHAEAMLLLLHCAYDADDDARALRAGMCARWPGGPLDRTDTGDHWSFALALDYQRSRARGQSFSAAVLSASAAWKFSAHLVAALQAEQTSAALDHSGDLAPAATVSLALGVTL